MVPKIQLLLRIKLNHKKLPSYKLLPWMITNTIMSGSLVAMAMVQTFVRCPRGCFSYKHNWEKKQKKTKLPRPEKKIVIISPDYVYNSLEDEPKMISWNWLFVEKKILKFAIYKNRHFWTITSTNVLPAVQQCKKQSPDRQYFWFNV